MPQSTIGYILSVDSTKFSKGALPVRWNCQEYDFIDRADEWVHSSVQEVKGLPENKYLIAGLTDAFNQTYALYNKIGVFPGEYGYHKLVVPDRVTENLGESDVIIVSHPFSADGLGSEFLLKEADKWNIPIFVDCAFFGVCMNINFDFTPYKNIESVGFSFSKSCGTGWERLGILYTKKRYPVAVYEEWNYPLYSSVSRHKNLINYYKPDIIKKFRSAQLEICEEYDLVPSDTVLFGLDYKDRYNEYRRGNVNRLCIKYF